jgi:outer membrane protein assembly complex protein YaeT
VTSGPRSRFSWEGDDPGSDLKKRIEARWDGRMPESFLVSDLAARARWELKSKRYYLAEVQARVDDEATERRVLFHVTLGPHGDRVALDFTGNQALSDEELTEALPSSSTPAFFTLVSDKQEELEKGIRLRYASLGYLETSVGEPVTSYGTRSKELRVTIPVDEGSLIKLASVRVAGESSLPKSELLDSMDVQAGQPVDLAKLDRATASVRALYRSEGYPDARVRTELERVPDGLAVTVQVEEGPRVNVGAIRIVGNLKTQTSVIRNELTFREGEPLRTPELQKSQKNLYDLGVFRTADVRVDSSSPGAETRDILVQVVERDIVDLSYGLRYNFVAGETGELDPEDEPKGLEAVLRAAFPNPFGRASTLGLTALISTDEPLYRASYLTPRFFGHHLSTMLYGEFEEKLEKRENKLPLRSREWSINFQQTKKLSSDKFTVQWNYSFGQFKPLRVSGTDIEFDDVVEYRTRIGASLIEDQRNSIANPTRGRFWNLTMQVSPELLGADQKFYRFYGQIFYFYPLGRKVVWASSYRLGLAGGTRINEELSRTRDPAFLLIEDRFEAGGANSVRGFKQDSLGPSVTLPDGEKLILGGEAVVVMNQELRFPIYKMLHGAVFYDTGQVYPTVRSVRLSRLRHTAGAGVRLVLPFGPLRLDWARILDFNPDAPDFDGKSNRLHFSFGYAF